MNMRKGSGEITSDREEIQKNVCRFLQVTIYPNSAHTGRYNEIKSRRRRNTRGYRISGKGHKKNEDTKPMGWMELQVIL